MIAQPAIFSARFFSEVFFLLELDLYYCMSHLDTPFEDGTFKLTMEFSEEYPNKPPVVKFLSKMFHPNIYADGGICLDILQNRLVNGQFGIMMHKRC